MVNFYLENRTNKKQEAVIRVSIAIRGTRLVTSTGYNIKPADWNAERHEVKPRKENWKKQTTYDINTALGNIRRHFDTYEKDHGEVTEEELRKEFKTFMGRIEIKEETPAATEEPKEPTFFERFDQFIKEESINNMWVPSTKRALNVIKGHIEAWNPETSFDMLTESVLSQYINYHRTDLDQREVTVEKQWRYVKWFLDWATRKGYNTNTAYQRFRPKFKITDKTIVFLDWDELMRLYKFKVPKTGKKVKLTTYDGIEYEKTVGLSSALDRVRDMFCFCCFTSLRYSDMRNLKRSDIVDGVINLTTVKTHDKIAIELNDYSKAILDKYEGMAFPGGTALPVISNQKMNDYLKELAELAGLNAPVTQIYYKNGERIEETKPKYSVIGTHAGRRTFICNALSMGIPADIVMKWTGHSDYAAMKPYIDIAQSEKSKAMAKFNER